MSDRYTIKDKIGQGGLGAVYKAFDENLSREVALKRVIPAEGEDPKEMAKNLLKEAKTLSSLQHPHIVTVYDVGEDSEGPFVVMEFLKGETLDTTIGRGALPYEDFQQVVIQSLEALVAAQALGITHRDLKPANVMVIWLPSGKFQIKILDFGLAKFSHQPSVQTMDANDSIMGSIYFMAPEQFERKPLDSRTDLYSLGAIYYFILTGKYPFNGDTAPQVMAAHMQHRFTPLERLRPDLPPFVIKWVNWLMSRDASDRPTDATEALKYFNEKKVGGKASAPNAVGTTSAKLVKSGPQPKGGAVSGKLVASPGTTSGKLIPPTAPPSAPGSTVPAAAPAKVVGDDPVIPVEAAHVIPDTPIQKGPGFFGSIPKIAYLTIPVLLGVVVWFYFTSKGTEERNRISKIFQGLVNRDDMSKFEGGKATKEDVEALAAFLDDPVDERDKNATLTLMLLDGPTIDKDITAMLSKHDGKVLANLIRVLGERGATEAFTPIYKSARSSDSNVRQEAFEALGKIGDKSHLDKMIELLDVAKSKTEKKIVATSVANVISKSDDIDGRVGPLISALPTLKEESQVAAIPYLGNLGGPLAYLKIKDYLRSANNEIRIEAIEALGEWANSEPLGELVDQVKSEREKSVKSAGVSAIASLSGKPGPFPESEIMAQLKEILDTMSTDGEKNEIYGATTQLADDSALEYWQKSSHKQKDVAINQIKDRKKTVVNASGAVVSLTPKKALYTPMGIVRSGILEAWEFGDIGWTFSIQQPGTYSIEIDQRSNAKNRGTYTVIVGDKMIRKRVESSGREFKPVTVGNVEFDSPGVYKIVIRPNSFDENDYLMDLQEVRLTVK